MTDMPAYRTLDVEVRGGRLRAGEWSRTTPADHHGGPLVLAIHGITASHRSWAPVARVLLDGAGHDGAGHDGAGPAVPGDAPRRLLAPDLRGRGRSNALPGPFGMAQHADDMAALLRAAGASSDAPAVVLGHSMGAFVSLVLADRHPELVDRLILVDGGLPLELPAGMSREEALHALLGPAIQRLSMEFPSAEAYLDYWRPHPAFAGTWGADVEDYIRYDLDGEPPHLRPSTALAAVAGDNEDLYGGDALLGALGRLRVPTVLLRAERGFLDDPARLYPDEALDRARREYPGIEVRDVPGTNHYTIIMADPGAAVVARTVAEAVRERTDGPHAVRAASPERVSDTPG
jgi:pimeloyl-ACP methyl ester carboxylesterase